MSRSDFPVILAEPAKLAGAPAATTAIPGLVWAFRLHGDGSAEPLPVDAPIEFSHDGRLWLHLNLTDARARQWVNDSNIPSLARHLLLSHDNYQQLHTVDNCVYGVFSDLVRDIDTATEETGFLRFAMTERLLISGRHQALCAVDATRRVLEGGHRVETVAALLEKIIDEVADTMDRMADKIGAEIDGIEEGILAGETRSETRGTLGRLRRTCVRLHRQLTGLRVLFHRLEQKNPDHLSPTLRLQRQAGATARRTGPRHHRAARAQPPPRGGNSFQAGRGEQPASPHALDRHHAAAAADAGHRRVRHEHEGLAADRRRDRFPLGRGADGRLCRSRLFLYAAHGHLQIASVALAAASCSDSRSQRPSVSFGLRGLERGCRGAVR
jgi:zinc transporter